MDQPKILERLWEGYRDKYIKPDCTPQDLMTIANVFYAGMVSMAKEFIAINQDVQKELVVEFNEFIKETDEHQRGNNPS
jgi:hypothetical protein